eukprot:scaffold131745_cov66-Phaeocystis_antarctica.AAC.3
MGGGEEAACLWTRKDRANSGQSSLRAAQANVGFDAGSLGSILARLALRLGIGELLSHAQHAPSLSRLTRIIIINPGPMRFVASFVACSRGWGSREGRARSPI